MVHSSQADAAKNISLHKAGTATKSIYAPDGEPDMPRAFTFGSPNGSWARSSNSRSHSVASPTWTHSPKSAVPWPLYDSRHTHTTSPSFLSGQPFTSMYDTFDLGDWEACTTDVSPDVTPVSPPCEPTLKPSPKKSSRPQRRTEGFSPEPRASPEHLKSAPKAISKDSKQSTRKTSSKESVPHANSKQSAPQATTSVPKEPRKVQPQPQPQQHKRSTEALQCSDNQRSTRTPSRGISPAARTPVKTHGRCGSSPLRCCSRGAIRTALPVDNPQPCLNPNGAASALKRRSCGAPTNTSQTRNGTSPSLEWHTCGARVDVSQCSGEGPHGGGHHRHPAGTSPTRPVQTGTSRGQNSADVTASASGVRKTPKPLSVKRIAAPRNMITSSPDSSPRSTPATPFKPRGQGDKSGQRTPTPTPPEDDALTVTRSQCMSPKRAGSKPGRRPPPSEDEALIMTRMHTQRASLKIGATPPHRQRQKTIAMLDSNGRNASALPNGCVLRAKTETTATSSTSRHKHKETQKHKRRPNTTSLVPPTALGADSKHGLHAYGAPQATPQVKRVSFDLKGHLRGRSASPVAPRRRRPPSIGGSCNSIATLGGASAPVERAPPNEEESYDHQQVSRWLEEVGRLNLQMDSGPGSTDYNNHVRFTSFCESETSLELPTGSGDTCFVVGEGAKFTEVRSPQTFGLVSDASGQVTGGCCGFKWRSAFERIVPPPAAHVNATCGAQRQPNGQSGSAKHGGQSPQRGHSSEHLQATPTNMTSVPGTTTAANYEYLQNMFGSLYSCLVELQGGGAKDGKLHMHEVDACTKLWRRGGRRRPGEPADAADIFTDANYSYSMSTYTS